MCASQFLVGDKYFYENEKDLGATSDFVSYEKITKLYECLSYLELTDGLADKSLHVQCEAKAFSYLQINLTDNNTGSFFHIFKMGFR